MQLYESRLSYFNDKARINCCKSLSVHQHGGRSRPRQNCHSCIFETNKNSNLRICIQYLGHHSKTTCQKSAKSMRYRVRPKFEFYRKSLLIQVGFTELQAYGQPGVNPWAMFAARGRATFVCFFVWSSGGEFFRVHGYSFLN